MLSLFPLNIVVYPNEDLNLHIFEPRYRQLINDCLEQKTTFGMPIYLENTLQNMGTEVRVVELVKRYDDGKMDVRVRGSQVFKLTDFVNPMPGKLHAGGQAERLAHVDDGGIVEKINLLKQVAELYQLLNVPLADLTPNTPLLSYRLAHKIGLSLAQEYQILALLEESARLEYLAEHLAQTLPVLREMERTKERIRLNGHFRKFDAINF